MTSTVNRMTVRAMPSGARGGGVPRPVPQRGQQDAPDLVQGEGVRARVVIVRDGGGGEDDVLGQPQQQACQFRVGVRAVGDVAPPPSCNALM
jgi:hypothetical protein